jgi:hypothetical protein
LRRERLLVLPDGAICLTATACRSAGQVHIDRPACL